MAQAAVDRADEGLLPATRRRIAVMRAERTAFAARRAEAMDWRLNHDIKGHRLGDFPHAIHKGGDLGDFASMPAPGLWVLEIQIAHPSEPFGAFYEDLLLDPAPAG